MHMIVSIDPGTDKSGVAVFVEGKLIELKMMALPALVEFIQATDAYFVIEDVEANKGIYAKHAQTSIAKTGRVGQNIGLVKATARHIISFMEWHNKPFKKIPPQSGNWGSIDTKYGTRALSDRLGWKGKSNKDTRSAAFFGWLALQQVKREEKLRA